MSTRLRRSVATLAAVATVALLPSVAQAETAPSSPTGSLRSGPVPQLAPLRDQLGNAGTAGAAREKARAAADARTAGDLAEYVAPCGPGYAPGQLLSTTSFEGSLPYPAESYGFNPTTSGGATAGSYNASSTISAGSVVLTYVNSTHASVPSGTRLGLTFDYIGSYVGNNGGINVNNDGGVLVPSNRWRSVSLDVTSQANTNNGLMDVYFFNNVEAAQSTNSTFRVDNVRLYTCVVAPFVRGDWSGDNKVDLLGIHDSGDLYLYPGRGNGSVGSATKVGNGWSGFNWAGSPGDVNGDRKTDLVGRRADGNLYLYAGLGSGRFASSRQIGSSWSAMTALATPTDMTNDGSPDLIARRNDNTLHLYSFQSSGALRYVKQIGSGWGQMRWIIGMGDLNGDGRGDTVGVNSTDGCLYAYNASASSTLSLKGKVGCGWFTMTWLTSPGDLNGDGYGDLVARNSAGELYFYRGRPGGGVYSGVKVGTGWNAMNFIL